MKLIYSRDGKFIRKENTGAAEFNDEGAVKFLAQLIINSNNDKKTKTA